MTIQFMGNRKQRKDKGRKRVPGGIKAPTAKGHAIKGAIGYGLLNASGTALLNAQMGESVAKGALTGGLYGAAAGGTVGAYIGNSRAKKHRRKQAGL